MRRYGVAHFEYESVCSYTVLRDYLVAKLQGTRTSAAGGVGMHNPVEEFVVIERVHGITFGSLASWAHGVE